MGVIFHLIQGSPYPPLMSISIEVGTSLLRLNRVGYNVDYLVLTSLNYGVPQMGQRVYFIRIRKILQKICLIIHGQLNLTFRSNMWRYGFYSFRYRCYIWWLSLILHGV